MALFISASKAALAFPLSATVRLSLPTAPPDGFWALTSELFFRLFPEAYSTGHVSSQRTSKDGQAHGPMAREGGHIGPRPWHGGGGGGGAQAIAWG